MKLSGLLQVAGAGVLAAGCSSDVVATRADTTKTCNVVRSVAVIPASATVHRGDTLRVSMPMPDPRFAKGCTGGPQAEIKWSSSDTVVAIVDSTAGLVRARSQGVASIIGKVVVDPTIQGAMVLQVAP